MHEGDGLVLFLVLRVRVVDDLDADVAGALAAGGPEVLHDVLALVGHGVLRRVEAPAAKHDVVRDVGAGLELDDGRGLDVLDRRHPDGGDVALGTGAGNLCTQFQGHDALLKAKSHPPYGVALKAFGK